MEFIKKHKRAYIIILSVICAAAIIFSALYRLRPTLVESALGYVVTPVQKYVTQGLNYIESRINFITNLYTIERENIRLREENELLRAELSRLTLVDSDNKKLSALLDVSAKNSDYKIFGSTIIAKDPGNWYYTFEIDKGTNQGFDKNMVVITSGGLVGRIIESGKTYSKVVSLIDDTFSVAAKSAKSDDIGFVRGDTNLMSQGLCRMDLIDAEAKILVGDEIVTSHLGGIYPPGITIGYVKEIVNDANGLTKSAIIQPTVDFKHLETVLVIIDVNQNNNIEEADE